MASEIDLVYSLLCILYTVYWYMYFLLLEIPELRRTGYGGNMLPHTTLQIFDIGGNETRDRIFFFLLKFMTRLGRYRCTLSLAVSNFGPELINEPLD